MKGPYHFRPQKAGGYAVFHEDTRIGWTCRAGRRWAATDTEKKSAGDCLTRHEAAVRLHQRYRNAFGNTHHG